MGNDHSAPDVSGTFGSLLWGESPAASSAELGDTSPARELVRAALHRATLGTGTVGREELQMLRKELPRMVRRAARACSRGVPSGL